MVAISSISKYVSLFVNTYMVGADELMGWDSVSDPLLAVSKLHYIGKDLSSWITLWRKIRSARFVEI